MNEKVKETQPEKEQEVVMTVYLPISVHRIIKAWGAKLSVERGEDVTVSQAYSEALKAFVKQQAA